jgi:histidinol phosphatase-like enzyme (inositol monophosphatase family)
MGYGRPMTQTPDLDGLEDFVLELNAAAAAAILPLFRVENGLEDKGGEAGFDPVTAADRGAEAAIRALISSRHPTHGVIGEEYGEDRPEAEFVWVLDPIDGTRAFIAGLPVWTTLIGLRIEGRPTVGSIGQPYVGELFIGGPAGARLLSRGGERPLKTRKGVALAQAIISTTDPHPSGYFKPWHTAAWERVRAGARLARMGCDAYAYAMVAAGTLDAVIEPGLKAWDIEAAIPVVAGAGGAVTDWQGRPRGAGGGDTLIVGDAALLEEIIPRLNLEA